MASSFRYRHTRINGMDDGELEEKLVEELNKLGENQWEVIQIFENGGGSPTSPKTYTVFLKQESVR